MTFVDELVSGILRSEEGFAEALRKILDDDLKISVPEFCQKTDLSQSTVYKILQDQREPNLRTVRAVIKAVQEDGHLPRGGVHRHNRRQTGAGQDRGAFATGRHEGGHASRSTPPRPWRRRSSPQ